MHSFLFADDDKPSIVDAISRMSSKQSSPKKSATKQPVDEVKQNISPADFFGLTPVHVRTDSKVLIVQPLSVDVTDMYLICTYLHA